MFEINSGISIHGLTNVEKVSIFLKVTSSNLTIAISIISSLYLSSQVVSRSIHIIIIIKNHLI
jgi:hypothetical protein